MSVIWPEGHAVPSSEMFYFFADVTAFFLDVLTQDCCDYVMSVISFFAIALFLSIFLPVYTFSYWNGCGEAMNQLCYSPFNQMGTQREEHKANLLPNGLEQH